MNVIATEHTGNRVRAVSAPKSWQRPASHYLEAMDNEWYRSLMDVQSDIAAATDTFFRSKGMRSTMLPITTTSISSPMGLGSDSLPVEVEIAGEKTFLADSMQFMLEYALRLQPEGVFYIMPTFRGEDHDARHLNQFYHSEAEICGTLDDVMRLVDQYVFFLAKEVLQHSRQALGAMCNGAPLHVEKFVNNGGVIPRIRFADAVLRLEMEPRYVEQCKEGFLRISNLGEKRLITQFGGPVWVTNMPSLSVPFYQANEDDAFEYSRTADLLMGIGETVGAGERHTTANDALQALARHEVSPEQYEWYLNMKKTRPLHTSGFGMGIERFILWLTGHDDIRDCQILPRLNGIPIVP
jgi:asparaginyl-tRNA synthetase